MIDVIAVTINVNDAMTEILGEYGVTA